MKILVISDSHSNIANLKRVMGFAEKIKIEAVVHCGDWDSVAAVETALSYKLSLYSILGNADVDPEIGEILAKKCKKFDRTFLEFKIDDRSIGITHKPGDIKKYFSGKKLDVVFCGHYHSKFEREIDGVKVVRPGAILTGVNFAVYDTVTNGVEFVEDE